MAMGQKIWEENYRRIIKKLLNKHFKHNRHILAYFHKLDSTGYRYHSHILLYPYQNNTKGFSKVYPSVEKKLLKQLKMDFAEELESFIQANKAKIESFIISQIKSYTGISNLQDNQVMDVFLNQNQNLKKYFK
jgi:hypothetical protein